MTYGVGQTSERMRAYHRAVRRKEPWAVKIEKALLYNPTLGRLQLLYNRGKAALTLHDLVYSHNPFLSMIPKNDGFMGAYIPKLLCYKKHGIRNRSRHRCHGDT